MLCFSVCFSLAFTGHIMLCFCFSTWIIWNYNEWLLMNSYKVHILKALCMILHCLCFPEGDNDNNDQTSTCLCKLLSTHQLHNATQRNATQHNTAWHNTTQPLKSLSQVLGGFFCISKSKNDAKACIILFEGLVRPQTDEISHSVDFVSSSEGLDVCVPGKSGVCLYIGRAEGGEGYIVANRHIDLLTDR